LTNIKKAEEIVQSTSEDVKNVKIARSFEDENTVILHTVYTYKDDSQQVAFDILTFDENEKITTHKTYHQPLITDTKSGRSMYDGSTELKDLDKTASNKTLISDYLKDVIGGGSEKNKDFFDGNKHIQHSPYLPDTYSGLLSTGLSRIKQGYVVDYQKIDTVFGQGNFVLIISEGRYGKGGVPSVFCDLYRIDNNKLAEHWDVIQAK
jgi:predicted SnoaL-like aldol condensation-catalyzing enzyme